ncbi:MAG: hypothetical protein DRH08_04300, partial [Deltaproteobacteria bacterium]
MRRGLGRLDIWGRDGLFEQRLGQKMALDERGMGVDEQNADTRQVFREGQLDVMGMNADTNRLANVDPRDMEDADQMGLRGLSRRGPTELFDNDGNTIGFRGSDVGGGGRGGGGGSRGLRSFRGRSGGTSGGEDEGGYLGGGVGDAAFFRKGGPVLEDPRTPEDIMAQEVAQQALASQERGGTMHRPMVRAPGYKWGTEPVPQPVLQHQPA